MSFPLKLDKLFLAEYSAEVMVYFEKHKLIEISARLLAEIALERPEDPQLWIAKNIVRIADDVYQMCLRFVCNRPCNDLKIPIMPGRFLHRVVIFGRRGSGRKTQAISLVKLFNLVYIDAEHLIYENLRGTTQLAKELQRVFESGNGDEKSMVVGKIVARRFLEMDALHRGWVLVNYPNNLCDFKELLENFKVPPNKVVFLQCPEKVAIRRLCSQPQLGRPQDFVDYFDYEMRYFNKEESAICEYLNKRYETILVDAVPCFEVVKTCLLAQLERVPYVMGFKN